MSPNPAIPSGESKRLKMRLAWIMHACVIEVGTVAHPKTAVNLTTASSVAAGNR
jgi:hypothetical protein